MKLSARDSISLIFYVEYCPFNGKKTNLYDLL